MSSAAKILEQRRRIRSDLVEWCRYAGYEPAKHHRLILQHLTDVAAGKIARLAVTLSPGAGKSTYLTSPCSPHGGWPTILLQTARL
jgi:hypothetical protein